MTRKTMKNVKALLKASHGHGFGKRWAVPGFGNAVSYAKKSFLGFEAVFWPCVDTDGHEMKRGLCLVRHRKLAKSELRKLATCATPHRGKLT